ncbi:mitochondrial ribosomal protein subunit L20-domain-containing protein [Cantharellus anzutake]|uniref:mitochondrial ribosomal protein subunit L20-domain-containing protein n=1 Tax=Cantharellus anzutake TaxID=1750568 RepID=UPI001907ED31|nr:mitochondrial ribosomal protein subunit L20-domain-containing protein [Cantharellus anzutake]KAF8340335.1 mitochondrial ribosomal protein subunit L20-domain-containing protein [Cantharellus anzutake]
MHRALPRPRDPLLTSTKAVIQELEPGVTFIKRPPPSAPSQHSLTTAPVSPLLRPIPLRNPLPSTDSSSSSVKRYHLTEEKIAEMRQLRRADPVKNSVISLARRFDCSRAFVQISAPLSREQRKKRDMELQAQREKWSNRKKLVREIRQRRKLFW